MKTRKQTGSKAYTLVFLRILDVIKLFHWNTKDYSKHKATDGLHESLSKLVDSYHHVSQCMKRCVMIHLRMMGF